MPLLLTQAACGRSRSPAYLQLASASSNSNQPETESKLELLCYQMRRINLTRRSLYLFALAFALGAELFLLERRCLRALRCLRLFLCFFMPVVEVLVVVVLVFEFCAKTKPPKLRTKTRIATIPKFFFTLSILLLNFSRWGSICYCSGNCYV